MDRVLHGGIVADYPTITDLINQAQSAVRPDASGPRLAFEVRVREEGNDFKLGTHTNTKVDTNGNLVLDDTNQDGERIVFMAFGVDVPPVSQILESAVEWTTTGTVNVYVSEDPDTSGWTQIAASADPVPFWSVGDIYFSKRLWVKLELIHGSTAPSVSLLQIRTMIAEADTSVDAPWPTQIDAAAWLWENATPGYWKDVLGGPEAAEGSLDYRYMKAVLTGLAWARLLLDRGIVRLDPKQALPEDFERLADWAGADPVTMSRLSAAFKKRYVGNARSLNRYRGTKALEQIFLDMFNTGTIIEWKPDTVTYPHRRVITVAGNLEVQSAKVLLRRHFPASVEIELHYLNAAPPVTDFTYTGFDSAEIGESAGTYYDYGWTLGEGETVELI